MQNEEPKLTTNQFDDTVSGESVRDWIKWKNKTREEEIKQAVKMATLLEHRAVIKEVEEWLESNKYRSVSWQDVLRAKLVDMKEGKV